MNTPLDSLMFYSKLLTGLVLVLNVLSLISIHLLVRWLKNPSRAMQVAPVTTVEDSRQFRSSARMILMTLLIFVIGINGLAIYGNLNLKQATEDVIAQMIEQ